MPVSEASSGTIKCQKPLRIRASRSSRAQTTVEFALICLPFFAILFALIDWAQIYFYENAMQNGMREAARFATSGRIIQNGTNTELNDDGVSVPQAITDSEGREASRNECIRYWFQTNCILQLPLSNITIVSAPTLPSVPPYTSTNAYGHLVLLQTNGAPAVQGPGGANDYMEIVVTNTIPTITPLFGYLGGYSRGGFTSYPICCAAIVKNEPALLNFQHTNYYADEPFDPNWANY